MDEFQRPASTMSEQEREEEFNRTPNPPTPTAIEEGVTRQQASAEEQAAKEQQVFKEQQVLNQQEPTPLPETSRTEAPLATGAADYPPTEIISDASTEGDISDGPVASPVDARPNKAPEPPVDPVLDKPMTPTAGTDDAKRASLAGTGTSAGLSVGVAPPPAPKEQKIPPLKSSRTRALRAIPATAPSHPLLTRGPTRLRSPRSTPYSTSP